MVLVVISQSGMVSHFVTYVLLTYPNRLNGQHLTYDEFRRAVEETRANNYIYEQSNDELLGVQNDARGGGGSVAQLSRFALRDKVTGHEIYSSTVILATIDLVEGRLVLTYLTEVTK